jgi:hypothetical protein
VVVVEADQEAGDEGGGRLERAAGEMMRREKRKPNEVDPMRAPATTSLIKRRQLRRA